jgi:predicted Zn-dependent protease
VEGRHGTKEATKAQLANQASMPMIYMGGWAGYATRQNAAAAIPLGFLKQHRAFELQADLFAAHMLQTAGMDPAALADYIERLQPENNVLPPRDERVAALRALPPASTLRPQPVIEPIQETLRKLLPEKPRTAPRLSR